MKAQPARFLLPALLLGTSLPGALAQDAAPPPTAPVEPALVFYSAGGEAFFPDPRDAALARTLGSWTARLAELPAEFDEAPFVPPAAVQLMADLLSSPMSLRVGIDPEAMGMPFWAQLDVHEPEEGRALSQRILPWIEMALPMPTEPSPEKPDMLLAESPMGPVHFGSRDAEGGALFSAAFGSLQESVYRPTGRDLPKTASTAWEMSADLEALAPVMEMALADMGEEAELVRIQLEAFGLMGENAGRFSMAFGYDATHALLSSRWTDYARVMQHSQAAMVIRDPVGAQALALVPRDATLVSLSRSDLPGALDTLLFAMTLDPESDLGEDPLAELAETIGIHLQYDVFDHLGTLAGVYLSDSTGGGGLSSAVAFVEVADATAMGQTLEGIVADLEAKVLPMAEGYARFESLQHGSTEVHVLRFPGLPMPLEPSFALQDGLLFAALSPQALLVGLDQARSQDAGIAGNPRFRAATAGHLGHASNLVFADSPRFVREGYGWTSMIHTALVNAMRSPQNAERLAAARMPTYPELMEGAQPFVSVGYWEGDDLVSIASWDRSWNASMAGLLGSPVMQFYAGAGVLAMASSMALFGIAEESESEPFTYELFGEEDSEEF